MTTSNLPWLLIFLIGCSSASYKLSNKAERCEGSSLSVEEEMEKIGLAASRQGTLCYDRKVKLSHGRHVHRMICNVSGRNVPFNSYTGDLKGCELAQKEILKNPRFGLEDIALTSYYQDGREAMKQSQESQLWYLDSKKKSCFRYDGQLEALINELEKQTGRPCGATVKEFSGVQTKVISCDDVFGISKTLLVTESEPSCRQNLKVLR